jgi:hypothetical protein
MPLEIRRLTPEQKAEIKRKLLEGKRFSSVEIQGTATAYDVSTLMVLKALREISRLLTEEEAARVWSNHAP